MRLLCYANRGRRPAISLKFMPRQPTGRPNGRPPGSTDKQPRQPREPIKSTKFAITISTDCKSKLEDYCYRDANVGGYCIARESYQESDLVRELHPDDANPERGFHVHAFIRFKDDGSKLLPEVRTWLLDCLQNNDLSINVQCCKNDRTWIRYITKEDDQPAWRGIDALYLSVRAQVAQLARQGIKPSSQHPVCATHFNQRNQVLSMWSEFYVSSFWACLSTITLHNLNLPGEGKNLTAAQLRYPSD